MKKRIAILHYSCYPVIGGVEKIIEAHARLFSNHGYKVKVIAGKGAVFDRRVSVNIIPEMHALEKTNQLISRELDSSMVTDKFYKRAGALYKKLKGQLRDSDIIIVHNIMTMHFNLPLTAALRKIITEESNKKFIIWTHDLAVKDLFYREKVKSTFPFSMLAEKTGNAAYVCISEYRKRQAARLLKLGKGEITVIPNGIWVKFLKAERITSHIFNFFGLFEQDMVLLLPARIVKRKNIELAIHIVKELNKFKKTKMVITGPPDPHNQDSIEYCRELMELAERLGLRDKVIFLFKFRPYLKEIRLSRKIMQDFYLMSDALLFPSRQEGFGIPMLEAGLSNKPIFCSDIKPLKEIGGKNVLYFSINDEPKKIASRIISYYNKSITKSMFKRVVRDYLWENIFSKKISPLMGSL